jgi:hypothetical protein
MNKVVPIRMASVDKYVMGQMRNPTVAKLYHDGDHPLAVAFYHAAEKKQADQFQQKAA